MDVNINITVDGVKQILRLKETSEETAAKIITAFFRNIDIEHIIEEDSYPLPDLSSFIESGKTDVNKSKDPEHWHTGIKTDPDGTKRYKCRYWCECGNQSNRYIALNVETVECHLCGYHLTVSAAGKPDSEGIPRRDSFGNFFVADAKGAS